VRVLDLTRVLASAVAGRFIAAYGANVLCIDPPGSDELLRESPMPAAAVRLCAPLARWRPRYGATTRLATL